MEYGRRTSKAEPLSENEKHHFSLYEKRPLGCLIDKKPKERTYFDSGDFALYAGERAIETGAIKPGREHPRRENISRPNAPVPSNSNVDYDANTSSDRKSVSPARESLLYYEAEKKPSD